MGICLQFAWIRKLNGFALIRPGSARLLDIVRITCGSDSEFARIRKLNGFAQIRPRFAQPQLRFDQPRFGAWQPPLYFGPICDLGLSELVSRKRVTQANLSGDAAGADHFPDKIVKGEDGKRFAAWQHLPRCTRRHHPSSCPWARTAPQWRPCSSARWSPPSPCTRSPAARTESVRLSLYPRSR